MVACLLQELLASGPKGIEHVVAQLLHSVASHIVQATAGKHLVCARLMRPKDILLLASYGALLSRKLVEGDQASTSPCPSAFWTGVPFERLFECIALQGQSAGLLTHVLGLGSRA